MRTDLFDFELPEALIALRPAEPRDAARLLVVEPGKPLADRTVRDLPSLLRAGDVLVVNDTRVIAGQLRGERYRKDGPTARVVLNLIKRVDPSRWLTLARPAKRLEVGDHIRFGETSDNACLIAGLDATVEARREGEALLAFDVSGLFLDDAIAAIGEMPLPPYIAHRRAPDDADKRDYQTVFAAQEGAVAAPTAGLHFTDALLAQLAERGIARQTLTLHVGPGTFLPVKADDTAAHHVYPEYGAISAETAAALNAARAAGGRIVAVGTTSARLLESAAAEDGTLSASAGETSLFIAPPYRFKAVDLLVTNFHLPRSTLFMLVSALSGRETMLAAYAHAVASGYRFYSYGDACLLYPEPTA